MNNNKIIKEIKVLTIILILVIILVIIINILNNNTEIYAITTANNLKVPLNEIKIDGMTLENIENLKGLIDDEIYNKYIERFEKIKNGEILYYDGMSIEEYTEKEQNEISNQIQNILKNN